MRPVLPLSVLALVLAIGACSAARAVEEGEEVATEAIDAMQPDTEPAGAARAIPPSGDSRMDGYGTLDFGMTADEAREAWNGNPLEPAADAAGDTMACHHLGPAGQSTPAQLAFMFEDDLFVRYSVESDEITAPGGGRVGMDEATLQGLYGKSLEASAHKYVEGGKILASPQDGGALPSILVFELDPAGVVTSWRVGLSPQVHYVEGCS